MSGTSLTRQKLPRRWRHAARAAAVLGGVIPAMIAVAAPAAHATTPTAPPPVTVLTSSPNDHAGDIFLTLSGDQSTYLNGPTILDPQGNVVWFHPIPAAQLSTDFREQAYNGRPVLTWWQGTSLGGHGAGTDYIYSADGQHLIATVNAGNGLSADLHEFLITPWNTALITAYQTATANLTSIGGPPNQTVYNGVAQEIDIKTGKVLFQWNSADHVPYSESETPLPASPSTPWDWFHINAVKVADDGSLLINGRDVWTTYDVDHTTGNINRQLGGKDSTFIEQAANGQTLDSAGDIFAWEHDPQQIGPDTFTWFDNEASPTELPYSRSVTVHLDFHNDTATLISSNAQPEGLSAGSQGNAQRATHGEQVVGWGALPYASTFSPSGQLVWNAEFPVGVNSYRAYRFPWPPDQNRHH